MPSQKIDWKYTTISRLRTEGIDVTVLDDDDALRLIRLYSERINRWCAQWFYPVNESIRLDGRNLPAIWRPDKIPIIEVDQLRVQVLGSNPSQGTVVPADDFEITTPPAFDAPGVLLELRVTGGFVRFNNRTRFLRIPAVGNFPRGPKNVEIDGTFGWIIEKDKVSSTITAALADDAISIIVADSSDFEVGDVVRMGDNVPFVYALIDTIDDGTKTLTFDKVGRITDLTSGEAIVTYGSIPEAIQYACLRLVIEFRHQLSSNKFAQALDSSSLTGEKIGDYSYTKQQPKWKNASTTGLRDVDLILQDYVALNVPIMTR